MDPTDSSTAAFVIVDTTAPVVTEAMPMTVECEMYANGDAYQAYIKKYNKGEYVGKTYFEAKQRPLFIIQDVIQNPPTSAVASVPAAAEGKSVNVISN